MLSYKLIYNTSKQKYEYKYVFVPNRQNYFKNNNFFKPQYNYNYNSYSNKSSLNDFTKPKPLFPTGTSKDYSADISTPITNLYSTRKSDVGRFGKKMKIFTYLLFVYNILLTLAVIIYSSITFDLDMLDYYLFFFIFFTASEVLYIPYSITIFIKKTLDESKCCYSIIVILSASLSFIAGIIGFTDGKEFPTGHYVIFIGGTSLLMSMSLVYSIICLVKGGSSY